MATRPATSPVIERLRALDPTDPLTPIALLDVLGAVDASKVSSEKAIAISREVERLTRAINNQPSTGKQGN